MPQAHKNLEDYLLAHEDDIATSQEDFGMLEPIFRELFGRKTRSYVDKLIEQKNKELAENMTHPSFVIEEVLHIPLTPAQKLQADKWRFNKIEMETGSASS